MLTEDTIEYQNRLKCNRTVCAQKHDLWYNKSTKKFYCQSCKIKISAWPENQNLFIKYQVCITCGGKGTNLINYGPENMVNEVCKTCNGLKYEPVFEG